MDNTYLLIFYGVIAILILVAFFLVLHIRNQQLLWQQRRLFQETEIAQQKMLLHAVIESQEIERKRIGEDLHDEIGGTLSAIKLMLGTIKSPDQNGDNPIVPAKQLIDKMIVDIRNISHDLSPPGLAMFGLYNTVEGFVSLINQTGEITIEINHESFVNERLLTEREELALFRIITQLIANTLKHANATQATLHFKPGKTQFEISYADNGKGFDPAILTERKGIGMQNIQSRLQMISASYTISTSLNNGFKIDMVIPLAANPEATA